MNTNELTSEIIGAAIEHELKLRDLRVDRQLLLPITYKDLEIEDAYRIDLLVENTVILELKTVEALKPIHNAQLLTYLRMSGKQIGYLLNFHEDVLRNGLRRFVHNLSE